MAEMLSLLPSDKNSISYPIDCSALTVVSLDCSQRILNPVISPLGATSSELQKIVGQPSFFISGVANSENIPELKRTTRDEPDYDKLMTWRLGILKEHGLGLKFPFLEKLSSSSKKVSISPLEVSALNSNMLSALLKVTERTGY